MIKFNLKEWDFVYKYHDMTPGMSYQMFWFKKNILPELEKFVWSYYETYETFNKFFKARNIDMKKLNFALFSDQLKNTKFKNFKYKGNDGWILSFEYKV